MKKDEGKPDPCLFYTSALYETVRVRAFGIKKHGDPEGWKTSTREQHLNAVIRHIRAVLDGEDFDDESGRLHLAHAICNCMFEIERLWMTMEGDPRDTIRARFEVGLGLRKRSMEEMTIEQKKEQEELQTRHQDVLYDKEKKDE